MSDETKTIIFGQPSEYSVKVGLSIGAKGERKPEVVITVANKCDTVNSDTIGIILQSSVEQCKSTVKSLMEE